MASHKGQKLADGKGVGGKGRLTKKRIDSFQVYYGRAIKENKGNVAEAQQAVQAILKHSMSTDRKPSHQYCPKEKHLGVAGRETKQGEHRLTTTEILCLKLWQMFCSHSLIA